jgi:hypothetical protein
MKSTENIRKLFEKYTDGDISETEKEYLTSILKSDSELQEEFELWKNIDKSIRKKDTIELRQKLEKIITATDKQYSNGSFRLSLFKKWYTVAAIFIIVLVSGYSLYYLVNNNKSQSVAKKESETAILNNELLVIGDTLYDNSKAQSSNNKPDTIAIDQEDDKLLAMNYQESTYLESSIGQTRSEDIQILKPEHSTEYLKGESIVFNWSSSIKETINLIILNNKEKVLYNIEISAKPYILKQRLVPGLYYWKLETDDDLLHLDKFYIHEP